MPPEDHIVAQLSPGKRFAFSAVTITLSIVFSIWVANTIIRKVERNRAEKYPDYAHVMRTGGLGPGGMLQEGFEDWVHDGYGRSVRWKNNSQGFRHDREFSQTPAPGVLRILSLGDSFTAGYRVGQEDTFSKLLENWSTNNLVPTEVLIAQIEHPNFGLAYLKEYGHRWSPHVVLLGITLGNDIAQSYVARHPSPIGFRHGLENLDLPTECFIQKDRFKQFFKKALYRVRRSRLYSAIFNSPIAINSWYGCKGNVKLFDVQNGLSMYIKNPPPEIEQAYQRLFLILKDYKQYCEKHKIILLVGIFPQRFQVQPGDWRATTVAYGLNPDKFDLMLPNKRMQDFCRRNDIICIDPTESMQRYHQKTANNMYLPRGDMHWNRFGHQAWFDGARPALSTKLQTVIDY